MLGEYISQYHTAGRAYQLAATDVTLWNSILSYAAKKDYSLTFTAMSHADGTLPGDWTLNKNEIAIVQATKTYKAYLDTLKNQMRSVTPGHYTVTFKDVTLNFKTLDGKTDGYNAFGDVRMSAKAEVCASAYSVAFKATIKLTDYYTFLGHGYNRLAWYTPTSLGWRLQSNEFLSAFAVSAEWNESTIVIFK